MDATTFPLPTDALESAARRYLSWQDELSGLLAAVDPAAKAREDTWERPEGGGGRSRVWAGGPLLEKAGVNFSDVQGAALPPAATAQRPHLAGQPWRAMGVSVVLHPRHPLVPTAHLNVRLFATTPRDGSTPVWWTGGGFDLTPYYGFDEDCRLWHRLAAKVCEPEPPGTYAAMKEACDRYFHLRHRGEARGIGGLFYDDRTTGGWEACLALQERLVMAFLAAWQAIAQRRRQQPYGEAQRQWQLYRRGRYVEFNLVYDRGTLFGLQSQGRTESILMSLPPLVRWDYDYHPAPDSPEERLLTHFLPPRDWLAEAEAAAAKAPTASSSAPTAKPAKW